MNKSYDVVVIGSGPGGYVAAIRLAQLGKSVCVIEFKEERLGGVCLNEGCIPTKALLNSAEVFESAKEAQNFGLDLNVAELDITKMIQRAMESSARLRSGIGFLFKKNKVDLIIGKCALKSKSSCVVSGDTKEEEILSDNFIIATGSQSKNLPGLQPDAKRVLTSSDVFKLKEIPKRLLVVGAGAIGIEFGSLFKSLGSGVTLVEVASQILPLEDAEISLEAAKYLKKRGVEIYTDSSVAKLETNLDSCKVSIKTPSAILNKEFDFVLLCIGRSANVEGLKLAEVGVKVEKGFIKVNKKFQTSVENIYAIGDCINTPMLAHVASAEAIVAAETIAGQSPKELNYDNIPSVVYSAFQVARVGLSEKEARDKGLDIKVSKHYFKSCAKAVLLHKDEGFVKIIADRNTGSIIGAHIVGIGASELIHEFVVAKTNNLKIQDLANTVHAHPTLSEIIQDAAKAVFDKPIHG